MASKADPRARGFNYGSPSRAGDRPPIYFEAMKIANALSQEAARAGQEAWSLQMAARHVRMACTPEELERTVENLERAVKPYLN
ncbi:hypothetical protein [Tsuneonella sp. HG222]